MGEEHVCETCFYEGFSEWPCVECVDFNHYRAAVQEPRSANAIPSDARMSSQTERGSNESTLSERLEDHQELDQEIVPAARRVTSHRGPEFVAKIIGRVMPIA